MKRKIYSKLREWKTAWNGSTAILIDGARRIGKSWIAEEFAKNEYKSYILIDFNNAGNAILDLFENYLSDLDAFFMRLSLICGVKLYNRQSVIIFDEVQMYPKARAAIKYLVKDGRFDYIETGSLVSINHNVKDIVIPSEEMRIDMYPMDFEEFTWACDCSDLYDFAHECFLKKIPLGQAIHRRLSDLLREYILIGGMPQAVITYIETKDIAKVDALKRNIISLYRNDIQKYAGRQAHNVARIFDLIPAMLQQHEKRFRPSIVKQNGRSKDFTEAMFWLDESRVVNFCYNCTEPSVALSLCKSEAKVKLYMADTGLLISMAFDAQALDREKIYQKILHDKLEFNQGMIVENLVAQLLIAAGHPLYFYSSSSTIAADRMEIDFLIHKNKVTSRYNISPIEVKSSTRYTIKSLEKFSSKFHQYLSQTIVLHTGDLEIRDGILYLPLYMAGML